jgi:transcriptional regulator with XRE-family HTH domain
MPRPRYSEAALAVIASGRRLDELADRLGVSPRTVSRWLQGQHTPDSRRLRSRVLAAGDDGEELFRRALRDVYGADLARQIVDRIPGRGAA